MRWLLVPSLIGGLVGVLLVTKLPPSMFDALVPWLILSAALLFALQPQIARLTGVGKPHAAPTGAKMAGIMLFQFLVAIYGGYFGAGIGILMLAELAILGLSDIHVMNAWKSLLGGSINAVAGVVFIIEQKVDWKLAMPMFFSAIVGGYFGAWAARRTNPAIVRRWVVAIGFCFAAYYFWKRFAS